MTHGRPYLRYQFTEHIEYLHLTPNTSQVYFQSLRNIQFFLARFRFQTSIIKKLMIAGKEWMNLSENLLFFLLTHFRFSDPNYLTQQSQPKVLNSNILKREIKSHLFWTSLVFFSIWFEYWVFHHKKYGLTDNRLYRYNRYRYR